VNFFFLSAGFSKISICTITRIHAVCRLVQPLCFPYVSLRSLDLGFHLSEGKWCGQSARETNTL